MKTQISRNSLRKNRQKRCRKRLLGTSERPRLSVFRSLKQIYVQVIDDNAQKTLFGIGTLSKAFKEKYSKAGGRTIKEADLLGKVVGELCQKHSITKVVFDRNGYKYTGVLAALADSIRENGIQI